MTMLNLKKITGLYYTYVGIANTYIKGFTAFIEINFKTERIELSNKPYRLYFIEGNKKTLAIDKYYWINRVPQEYEDDVKHESILGNKVVTISFNLLLGKMKDLKYIRTVKIILEEEGKLPRLALWDSGNLNLISKKIDIPKMKSLHRFVDGSLISEVDLIWDKDADFNHNSKGINLLIEVKAYNSMQTIKTYRQTTINYKNVISISGVPEHGSYEVITSIIDLKGSVIQTDVFHHVHIYKPLDIYLKTRNSIVQPLFAYIKTETGIKKIKLLSSNY